MQKLEAREANIAAAHRALATQFPPHPSSGDRASEGMRPLPSQRRRTREPPAKLGSVSQATKNRQAADDARNKKQ